MNLRTRVKRQSLSISTLKKDLLDEKMRRAYVLKPDAARRRCTLTIAGLYRLGIKRNLGDGGCLSLIDTVEAQVGRHCVTRAEKMLGTFFSIASRSWYEAGYSAVEKFHAILAEDGCGN